MYEVVLDRPRLVSSDHRKVIKGPNFIPKLVHDLHGEDRESFMAVYVDTRHRMIGVPYLISLGSLNMSLVHPREVFREAIRVGAAALVVAHNHPSGNVRPSPDDLELTARLSRAGDLLGITLLDHVIVAESGDWLSLREQGWPT